MGEKSSWQAEHKSQNAKEVTAGNPAKAGSTLQIFPYAAARDRKKNPYSVWKRSVYHRCWHYINTRGYRHMHTHTLGQVIY